MRRYAVHAASRSIALFTAIALTAPNSALALRPAFTDDPKGQSRSGLEEALRSDESPKPIQVALASPGPSIAPAVVPAPTARPAIDAGLEERGKLIRRMRLLEFEVDGVIVDPKPSLKGRFVIVKVERGAAPPYQKSIWAIPEELARLPESFESLGEYYTKAVAFNLDSLMRSRTARYLAPSPIRVEDWVVRPSSYHPLPKGLDSRRKELDDLLVPAILRPHRKGPAWNFPRPSELLVDALHLWDDPITPGGIRRFFLSPTEEKVFKKVSELIEQAGGKDVGSAAWQQRRDEAASGIIEYIHYARIFPAAGLEEPPAETLTPEAVRIAIAEDNPPLGKLLLALVIETLNRHPQGIRIQSGQVRLFTAGHEANDWIRKEKPQLVITDDHLTDGNWGGVITTTAYSANPKVAIVWESSNRYSSSFITEDIGKRWNNEDITRIVRDHILNRLAADPSADSLGTGLEEPPAAEVIGSRVSPLLARGRLNRADAEAHRAEAFQEAREAALALGGQIFDGTIDRTGEEPKLPASLELLRILPEDSVTLRIPRGGVGADTLPQIGALTFLVQEGLNLPPAWRGVVGEVRTLPGRIEEAAPMVKEAVEQGGTVVLVL